MSVAAAHMSADGGDTRVWAQAAACSPRDASASSTRCATSSGARLKRVCVFRACRYHALSDAQAYVRVFDAAYQRSLILRSESRCSTSTATSRLQFMVVRTLVEERTVCQQQRIRRTCHVALRGTRRYSAMLPGTRRRPSGTRANLHTPCQAMREGGYYVILRRR